MDEVEVQSKVGEGTVIKMKKKNLVQEKVKRMEQTIAYIKRAHKGDKQAKRYAGAWKSGAGLECGTKDF